MGYIEPERRSANPCIVNLFLPANAPSVRRIVQRKLIVAPDEARRSTDAKSWLAVPAALHSARQHNGAILLREDKRRPRHISAR